ncbi:MAG: extracellular solute-binding protein, partial [Dictyoglomaceae bacterium]|nr:extracellular solute-binding protein [Dictyoglomaceae bacterium]
MKIPIKLILLVFLLISIVISSSFSKEVITLRVSWWGSQDRHNRTLKVIELFQQKYPHIKIVPEYSGWGDYWTILTTQAAGRNLPDVIQHDYQFLAEWVKRGLLRSIDDLVAQNIIKVSDVPDAYVAPGRVEGKLFAINLGVNSFGIVYDPELLKKAGISSLKWNWTWEEFKNIAKQV